MKQISFLVCLAVIMFSSSSTAQNVNIDQLNTGQNKYVVFNQGNSLNYDLFYDHEYDNEFGSYRFLPTSQSLRYNRVDALFFGIGSDFTDPNSEILNIGGLDFDGFVGYSTGQKDWQYRAEVSKPFSNFFMIGGELRNSSTTNDYWRSGLSENTISSLVAGYDYHDYYKSEGYSIFSEAKIGRFISVAGSYNYTKYSTLLTSTDYSFFDGGNIGRINPAIDADTDLITQESIGLHLGINKKGYTKGIFTTKFLLEAELSDALSFKNDFIYNKFEITSQNYIKIDRNTLFKVRMMAGSITGTAPDFKNFALGGIGTLRAAGYKSYTGDRMLLSNTEIVFGDFWEFDRGNLEIEGLYISMFLDSGWSDFVDNNSKDPFSGFEAFNFSDLTHNLGAGIGTGIVRFEVATPVAGSDGFTSLWIRLNPTF